MERHHVSTLIDHLEMRNMAMDYTALWCPKCFYCAIIARDGARKPLITMHKGLHPCEAELKEAHLAECIRDLKGETEK